MAAPEIRRDRREAGETERPRWQRCADDAWCENAGFQPGLGARGRVSTLTLNGRLVDSVLRVRPIYVITGCVAILQAAYILELSNNTPTESRN